MSLGGLNGWNGVTFIPLSICVLYLANFLPSEILLATICKVIGRLFHLSQTVGGGRVRRGYLRYQELSLLAM